MQICSNFDSIKTILDVTNTSIQNIKFRLHSFKHLDIWPLKQTHLTKFAYPTTRSTATHCHALLNPLIAPLVGKQCVATINSPIRNPDKAKYNIPTASPSLRFSSTNSVHNHSSFTLIRIPRSIFTEVH